MVRVKVVPLADDGQAGARSFGGGASRRVPSLLFDLDDLSESAQHSAELADETSAAEVEQKLQTLLEPWSEPEYMLLLHVRFAREDAAKRGQPLTVPGLADVLRRLGYAVNTRSAPGGGSGGACLRSLRHSFLTVSVAGPSGLTSNVVDPRFRDQFEIAPRACTPRYAKILEHVAEDLAMPHDRLTKVVEILCAEMSRAFAQTGTPLPPWRQQAAMLSKWNPRRSEELDLGAALPSPPPPGQQPGGAPGAKRLTGPSTVAQRLAMLGVAQQQSNPSPIAEGLEHAGAESDPAKRPCEEKEWLALGAAASHSPSGSLLGSGQGMEETQQPPVPEADVQGSPLRRTSADHAIPAAGRAAAQPRGKAILESIRAAAAALPHRRHNTWAG